MSNQPNVSVTKPNIEVAELRIDGFAGLPASKGVDFVDSPELSCFGHRWCLCIYPGGHNGSNDGYVGVYLRHKSDGSIKVQCTFIVEGSTSKAAAYCNLLSRVYQPGMSSWGDSNFAERTVLLGALEQGALVIKVEMTQPESSSGSSQHFFPGNPLFKNIMKKFNHEESADVVFDVSCCGTEDECEEPTKLFAHRLILEDGAPTLFDLTGPGDGSLTRIPITDVEPSIFDGLLSYVYGGNVESGDLKDSAKTYIDAADKYNVVNLKLEAEASLVSTTLFTIDNVLEFLLYADEKNCALLKEASMDFLVKNHDEAQTLSFDNVPGYLMKDLLAAFEMKEDLRVGALRKRLSDQGLDADGSREAMITRLENAVESDH